MLSLSGAGRYRKCRYRFSLCLLDYASVYVCVLYIFMCVCLCLPTSFFSHKNKLNQTPRLPEAWCWMGMIHRQSSLHFLFHWRLLKTFAVAGKGAGFCPLKVFLSLCRKKISKHFARVDGGFPCALVSVFSDL